MEGHTEETQEDFARSTTSVPYAAENFVVVAREDGEDDVLVSEKLGTRKDQMDMVRMGKQQELKVYTHLRFLAMDNGLKTNRSLG